MTRTIHLTTAVLRKKVAKRTGLPESLVGQVLDAVLAEMQTELIQQGTVKLRGLATISTTVRKISGSALRRASGKRVLLTIRPHKSFRDRLNRIILS